LKDNKLSYPQKFESLKKGLYLFFYTFYKLADIQNLNSISKKTKAGRIWAISGRTMFGQPRSGTGERASADSNG
jgi:hypothetical protein